MIPFNQLLKGYLQNKHINIAALINHTKIDRSTVYKYIRGKRVPSPEHVKLLASFMNLTPSEQEDFFEAYHILKIGEGVFYQRKNVESFILNFPQPAKTRHECQKQFARDPKSTQPSFSSERTFKALLTSMEVNTCVCHLLVHETHKQHGKIALFLQPDYDFLFRLLSVALSPGSSVQIEHIFCLSNTLQFTSDHRLYNLLYLQEILPVFMNALDYHVFYYYDNLDSHFHNFNGFPCFILTGDEAVLCTADYQSGIFLCDRDTVDMLWKLFLDYKGKCKPLFQTIHSVAEECEILGNLDWYASQSYALQSEPCLVPFITREMLHKYIILDPKEKQAVLPIVKTFIASRKSTLSNENMRIYQTKKGVEDFLSSGRLREIGDDFYHPFSPEDRHCLLNSLYEHCPFGHSFLLKGTLAELPDNFHLCVNASVGYLLFNDYYGKQNYLLFREPVFLSIFHDYMASLDEKYLCSKEEYIHYLEKVLKNSRIKISHNQGSGCSEVFQTQQQNNK